MYIYIYTYIYFENEKTCILYMSMYMYMYTLKIPCDGRRRRRFKAHSICLIPTGEVVRSIPPIKMEIWGMVYDIVLPCFTHTEPDADVV